MDTPAATQHKPRAQDDARRRPFPWRPKALGGLLKDAAREFVTDKAPKQAAAVAYYTLFALGPLLVLAISIAALVFGADAARDAVVGQVGGLVGAEGGKVVGEMLVATQSRRLGAFGAAFGLVVLLFSAGAVFAQLKEALNRIWEVEAKERKGLKQKVFGALRKNMMSFAGVVGTGFLLMVSLLVSTLLAAAGTFMQGMIPGSEAMWLVVNLAVSAVVLTLGFMVIFRFLPDTRVAWRDVAIGGAMTAILFLVGQVAIGYYLGSGSVGRTFGAGSAIISILVWIYYSAIILFFGAELTQVYANKYGSRVRPNRESEPLVDAVERKQASPDQEGLDEREGPRRPADKGRGRVT